jgi:hypothetical protein
MTNAATQRGGDDIGFHVLTGHPLAPPPKARSEHHAIAFNGASFDGLVGVYQFAPGVTLTVTRRGDHGFAQLTGQEAFEIFPESDTDYFYRIVDAQLTFARTAGGVATAVTLHQAGRDQSAARVGEP